MVRTQGVLLFAPQAQVQSSFQYFEMNSWHSSTCRSYFLVVEVNEHGTRSRPVEAWGLA